MGRKEALIRELTEFKNRLEKAVGVSKIIFFGSLAEGTGNENSDVDLIIVSEEFSKLNFIQRSARMYDYWTVKLPVDFLCYTPNEFNELSNKITIVKHAVKHGIKI